jgi:hypothetical protein
MGTKAHCVWKIVMSSCDDVFENLLGIRRMLMSMIDHLYTQEREHVQDEITFIQSLLQKTEDMDFKHYLEKEIRRKQMHMEHVRNNLSC